MIKPDAVIFDMDGVIFDTEKLCLTCWEKIAEDHGLEGMQDAFYQCIGTTAVQTKNIMMNHYGKEFEYDEFAKHASILFHKEVEENGIPMKPGIIELLQELHKKEIPIGLASSTRLAIVEKELKCAGIYEYFNVIVGGDLLKKSKPEPDIYLLACEKMHVNPKNSVAIEDSYNGIRSAYNAEMQPIMVPDLIPPDDEMKEKSVRILKSLRDLIPIIAAM